MTRRNQSGGGMTGATGDLTPDDIQRDFEPGEWREASDPAHHADVTRSQASHAHEHITPAEPEAEEPPSEGHEEHESREPRIGGDERADHEEHL
jgi:hypothetical protein